MSAKTKIVKIAAITLRITADRTEVEAWNGLTRKELAAALRARGIGIPKTKSEMIERIKRWAIDAKVPVTVVVG